MFLFFKYKNIDTVMKVSVITNEIEIPISWYNGANMKASIRFIKPPIIIILENDFL